MRSGRTGTLVALLLGVALLVGISRLFILRFRTGDVYPPYSTLRSDPIGARVLCEGLDRCTGVDVSRCFDPLARSNLEALPPATALLFLGDHLSASRNATVSLESANRLNAFMRRGGRLIVTLKPRANLLSLDLFDLEMDNEPDETDTSPGEDGETGAGETGANAEDGEDEEREDGEDSKEVETRWDEGEVPLPRERDRGERTIALADWLGASLTFADIDETGTASATPGALELGLPTSVICRTTCCFGKLTDDWRVMYSRGDNPVIIERTLGKGSLVLSSPSFFVSNQALRSQRQTPLLLWLIGGRTSIVFDEFHHGIKTPQGVVMLARRYRLHGFGAGLALLALLFVWQNAFSLVPPFAGSRSAPMVIFSPGKDSVSGLVNLLRRNVPTGRILETCIDEWEQSEAHSGTDSRRRLTAMREIARAPRAKDRGKPNMADAYNRIATFLHEQRRDRKPAQTEETAT